jgi:predicted ester cyclase
MLRLRNSFSDLRFEEHEIIEQDERVAARVRMHGKHTGVFFGIAPTGKPFAQEQAHFFRCERGRIAEHRAVGDDGGLRVHLLGGSE